MGTIELKISTTELKIGPIFKHICKFYLVSISLLVDNEVVNAVFQILWGVSDTITYFYFFYTYLQFNCNNLQFSCNYLQMNYTAL